MVAYCWRSGQIGFGRRAPRGSLEIITGPGRHVRRVVEALARHAYHSEALLVPGIPEADTDDQALDALRGFVSEVRRRPIRTGALV